MAEASEETSAQASPEKANTPNKPRSIAPSADVGMVPVASGTTRNGNAPDVTAEAIATALPTSATSSTQEPPAQEPPAQKPAAKALSPQARKSQATQQQLEAALTKSLPEAFLPEEKASASQGLILGLEPEASGKTLTVTLSDRWYQLGPEQQDAIASALWNQRSSLKIQQLNLRDSAGRILARPPVIGNQVVILRR